MHNEREQKIMEAAGIVSRLEAVQAERSLSDRQLLDEFPDLGSTKTWRQRLLAGKWAEVNLDRMLIRLRRIATVLDGGLPDEEFFNDLPFAQEFLRRLARLELQTTDRRILMVLAPNGTGKSVTARFAVAQKQSRRIYLRLRSTWRNKALHICNGLALALGQPTAGNAAEAESRVIAALKNSPRTVFLDQAHEGGVVLMHLLRSFVDETPSRFVYLAYDTAYRAVKTASNDALIEAQAFLGRCLKPIFNAYAGGTKTGDVKLLLERLAGMKTRAAESLAAVLTPTLRETYNLRLLADAIGRARAEADDQDPGSDEIRSRIEELTGLRLAETRTEDEPETKATP